MRKFAIMVLVAFGLVSVSFGVDLYSNEEPYQKLKAEVEMYDDGKECIKWDYELCHFKNVIAFFDEIRAIEDDKDDFHKAVEKVREMPRFKNDSGIYSYVRTSFRGGAVFKEEAFWESVWSKWNRMKIQLESRAAKKGYWEAVKKESE